MEKTATQMAAERTLQDYEETRMHQMHKHFRHRWAPSDPRDRDEFEADLARLMHELHREALKPFHDAAARQLAIQIPKPVFIKEP